jgi:chemotaxis protein CheX
MKASHISPFAEASMVILAAVSGEVPVRGALSVRPTMFTTQQVNVVCGITGEVEGLVIFGMGISTADLLASRILKQPVVTFDQVAAKAVTELCAALASKGAELLSEQGTNCEISAPTIVRGRKVKISTLDASALTIPLQLGKVGIVEVNVSLNERRRLAS